MILKCLFKGHKIYKGKCIQCLKSECDIAGHKWIYSNIMQRGHPFGGTFVYPTKRICNICDVVEEYINAEWIRTK